MYDKMQRHTLPQSATMYSRSPLLQRSIVYAIRAISMSSKCIELNTNFRILAKNEFEKNLFKLMNNAGFSKIMENMRNHINVQFVMCWDGRSV